MSADFYSKVPKERDANLRYRVKLRKAAAKDPVVQRRLISACRQDVLFFFNAFCLAEGTLVVTNEGLVPIEQVTPCHLVWDGESWVSQEGPICQGVKPVIRAYGIHLTPDHKVWTKHGWKVASDGYERAPVRPPDGGWKGQELRQRAGEMGLPMRLRQGDAGVGLESSSGDVQVVWVHEGDRIPPHSRKIIDPELLHLEGNDQQVFESQKPSIQEVWWSGDQSLREVAHSGELFGGHGRFARRSNTGADRQRWPLLPRELPLGNAERAVEQHEPQPPYRYAPGKNDDGPGCEDRWNHPVGDAMACGEGPDWRGSTGPSAPVYDLINCGPNRCFTVIGRDGRPTVVSNCWLYEPRPRVINGRRQPMTIPFLTWPHQDDLILDVVPNLGFEDIGIEKSRGEGMSWIAVLLAMHGWLFQDSVKIGFVSRTEAAADDPEDPDSLLWKGDWELTKLPSWMSGVKGRDYKRIMDRHTLTNLRNGSRIVAGAATGDVFRGGRLTWALMDEFAFFKKGEDAEALNSSHGATNSRLFISTVNGAHNEFHRVMMEPSSMVKVVMDWKKNVSRNRGLYTIKDGKPVAVDPKKNPLPKHYNPPSPEVQDLFSRLRKKGFRLEDKERSPWYDHECDRPGMTPQRIAQELDRDYSGSEFLVFGAEFMQKVEKSVLPPTHVGRFSVHEETTHGQLDMKVEFNSVWDGPVKLWMPIDMHGRPPRGNYVLGADVSTGLGGAYTSNSTLIGIDLNTMEQVLEVASNTIPPAEFADLSVGIANWLYGAYLGWEHNGPGSAYTKRIIQVGYGNVYRRKSQSKHSRKQTEELGWWTDDKTKEAMFSEITRAVRGSEILIRSDTLKNEFRQYVYINGKIEHAASLTTDDGSSKGKAHGDRVIGFGVALQCAQDRPADVMVSQAQGQTAPPNTMAERMQQYTEEDAGKERDPDRWFGSVLDRVRGPHAVR